MFSTISPPLLLILTSIQLAGQMLLKDFHLKDTALEVTLWAESPLLYNPTNFDVDAKGRIWVTEGVNYRRSKTRTAGDRVVVVEDTDLDGTADNRLCLFRTLILWHPWESG